MNDTVERTEAEAARMLSARREDQRKARTRECRYRRHAFALMIRLANADHRRRHVSERRKVARRSD